VATSAGLVSRVRGHNVGRPLCGIVEYIQWLEPLLARFQVCIQSKLTTHRPSTILTTLIRLSIACRHTHTHTYIHIHTHTHTHIAYYTYHETALRRCNSHWSSITGCNSTVDVMVVPLRRCHVVGPLKPTINISSTQIRFILVGGRQETCKL